MAKKTLHRITDLPSASTPLSGGELFEIAQRDINGTFKSRRVNLRKIVNPDQDEHNELKNLQGGDSTLNEYYHLTQEYYDKVVGDLYTLRTETLAVSANALLQANDYTDTQSQEASANALLQANDYTDTQSQEASANALLQANDYTDTQSQEASANALLQANDYTDTQSQEASANALLQANDYTDTQSQEASANALLQANDYTDTQSQEASANALLQANDYTDTQSQEASANALLQANDYTDTEILALSASYDQHNELKDIQGGIPSAAEYYHLSQSIHDALFSASPIIGLGNKTGTRFEVDYGSNLVKGFIDDTELLELNSEGINIGGAVSGSSVHTNTIHALTGVVTISGSSGVDLRASNNKNRVIVDSGYTRILVDATNTDHDNKNFEVFRVDQDGTNLYLGNLLAGTYLQYEYESDPRIRIRSGTDTWFSITPNTQQLGNGSSSNANIRVSSSGAIEGYALGTKVLDLDTSNHSIYQFGTIFNGMIFTGNIAPSASITFELNNEPIFTMNRLTRHMNLQGRLSVDSYADTNQAADLRAYQEMPGKSDFSKWVNSPKTILPEEHIAFCHFRGNLYIIGGKQDGTSTEYNTVYRSTNGKDWTLLTSAAFPSADSELQVVNFQDQMLAFGGNHLDGVYSSTDGITWTIISTDADIPGRRATVVVYKGKIWAYGDNFGQNDIHYSDDGISWTKLSGAFAPETIRMSMCVYNNAIFSVGGQDKDSGAAQDGVWKSTDGINFTQVGTVPYITTGNALLNYDGRMVILALGSDGVTNPDGWQDRIYESFDGITWNDVGYSMPTRAFFVSNGREATVFNGRIIYGGVTKTDSSTADPDFHQTMPRVDIGLQISGDLDISNSGVETISNGTSGATITFPVSQPDTNYYPIVTLENITDSNPLFLQIIVSSKAVGNFGIKLSGLTDSGNYKLNWMITNRR